MRTPAGTAVSMLALLLALATLAAGCGRRERTIVIGSKNFTEQIILGELLAQQIEARTKLTVSRRFNLGGTFVCHQALVRGEIDAYVEYTGTASTAILNIPPSDKSDDLLNKVREEYRRRFHLEWLPPLGFNNTFALMIRGEAARRLRIKTISQLAQYAPRWHAGFGYEFLERSDGFPGLARLYGLRFAEPPRVMDLALTYQALADHRVDVIAGDSTNGLIITLDLAVLEDDRRYFTSYQAAPVVSEAALPHIREALSALEGAMTDDDMRTLNYQVDGQRLDVKRVVREFRRSKGLVPSN